MKNIKRERFIPDNSVKIENEDLKAVCYLQSFENARNKYAVMGYSGKKSKNDFYFGYRTLKAAEEKIEEHFAGIQRGLDYKQERKNIQKANLIKFKKTIKPGVYLRTSFSYEMTFNYAFIVTKVSGNKITVQPLKMKWVTGNPGYTGTVSVTKEFADKNPIECKITSLGLKIENDYATLTSIGAEFYENHVD